MKIKIFFVILVLICSSYFGLSVFGGCSPSWTSSGVFKTCPDRPEDQRDWRITWWDIVEVKPNFAYGDCCSFGRECSPILQEPVSFPDGAYEEWSETAYDRICTGFTGCANDGGPRTIRSKRRCPRRTECLSGRTISGEQFFEDDAENICSSCSPSPSEMQDCSSWGGTYDWTNCFCGASPIVIDVAGDGFNLTNAANGVDFDINGDARTERISWTSTNSDDAWLALDRNGNDLIDSGAELFGNFTDQPTLKEKGKNGFLALAEYDKPASGGNQDGAIDNQDAVFADLRLWQDANHNGVSEASEMKTLGELGLKKIELDYKESKRTDEHGNRFKYRAKVWDTRGAQMNRWAWDVYLVVQTAKH